MKRTLLILLACLCVLGTVGCHSGSTTDITNYSGTDLAKLLLASERLNADLLKKEGDIFDEGAEVLRNLAATTSASYKASTSSAAQGKGTVSVNGNTFTFANFEENSNSYDYFENLSENVISTCNVGADMIDFVKKNVRVVDKWVVSGEEQRFYLHVSENEEVLYEYSEGQINICRRMTNTSGLDVYDVYTVNDIAETRMTYIPDFRIELSIRTYDGQNWTATYFTADSSKGYWEVSVIDDFVDHINVTLMAMKDDICYSAYYNPQDGTVSQVHVISSDRKTDLLRFIDEEDSSRVTLILNGFTGFQNVTITADPDAISSVQNTDTVVVHVPGADGYTTITGVQSGIVHLNNGKTMTQGDLFAGDQVEVASVLANYNSGLCRGDVELSISGDTRAARFANFRLFLAETGLNSRRNTEKMLGDISRIYTELDAFVPYYRWNGNGVSDVAGIRAGIALEQARMAAMKALYEDVKDDPRVDINDANFELNIHFAPITEINVEKSGAEEDVITVQNIALTITDKTLFVKDEPYKVHLALIQESGNDLIHLEVENDDHVSYTGSRTFTVTADQITAKIPALPERSYKVVAYISTVDDIRASGYKSFMDLNVEPATEIVLTTDQKVDYEAFRTLVCQEAYSFGVPAQSAIECLKGETYQPMLGNETEIASGQYRLAYTVSEGGEDRTGYVYIAYTAP
ncbi:MAG: hypothetical protein J6L76_04060 [Clostridia bacterium]|nr:hypothetical protein [Clostridia bacterium]